MERVNRELIQSALEQEGEEVTLDVDATQIEAEKREAQWTYHHVQGYMPLVGYVNGICVGQEFREGNVSPGQVLPNLALLTRDQERYEPRMSPYADSSLLISYYINDAKSMGAQAILHATTEALLFAGLHHLEMRNALAPR
jgi:hypothetical protein